MSDSSGEKAKREALRILEQFLGIQPDVAGLLEIGAIHSVRRGWIAA